MSTKEFEVLAIDESGRSTIDSEHQLAYSVLSNSLISSDGTYDKAKHEIVVHSTKIKVSKIATDVSDAHIGKGFLLKAKGPHSELEPLREKLVAHIKLQHFGPLYILQDEISKEIACGLYPQIYEVENALRGYLIKFMSTRIGPRWWEATASGEWRKKVSERKNNETVFSKHVDSSAYLIDFSDLGKMVYEQSSGFNSKDDVIRKITECDETPEAIKKLKEELKSNYQKFFKQHFRDNDFQHKWETLQWYRNKVAHNNLFVEQDSITAKEISTSLLAIIKSASDEIPNIQIEEAERAAIRESIVEKGLAFEVVTEEKFMHELARAEQYFDEPGKYVGLSHFIKSHLGTMGYDYANSYAVAEKLQALGRLEFYKVKHPNDEYEVTAVRVIEAAEPNA